jgi:hypothetical protein
MTFNKNKLEGNVRFVGGPLRQRSQPTSIMDLVESPYYRCEVCPLHNRFPSFRSSFLHPYNNHLHSTFPDFFISHFLVQVTLPIPLPPAYMGNEVAGIRQAFTEILFKYHSQLGGSIIAFSNPRFSMSKPSSYIHSNHPTVPLAYIMDEQPTLHVYGSVDALLFQPKIDSVIRGRISRIDPSYVAILVGNIFNASIAIAEMMNSYQYNSNFNNFSKINNESSSSANQIIELNMETLEVGQPIYFRVKSLSYGIVFTITGTFEQSVSVQSSTSGQKTKVKKTKKASQ